MEEQIRKAEINSEGSVLCPICGYGQDAEPGIIPCEYCRKEFEAVFKKTANQ